MEEINQLRSELDNYKRKCSELEGELEYAQQGIDYWKSMYLDPNHRIEDTQYAIDRLEETRKEDEYCEKLLEEIRRENIELNLYKK